MSWVLRWYLLVQLLGLLAFLILRPSLRRLPDGGWAIAKPLGVLLFGLLSWLATAVGLLRHDRGGGALLLVLALGAVAALPRRRATGLRWLVARRRSLLLATEAIFLLAFAGWAVVRSKDPSIRHTEQPMDLLMLVAVQTHAEFPPPDPWLSGEPIGYYYLGYWTVSTLALVTATPPEIAYNVSLACWSALLAVAAFGLGAALVAASSPRERSRGRPVAGGLLAAAAVGLVGNLHHALEAGRAAIAGAAPARGAWWWWQASRTLQDRDLAGRPVELITEFPFFSHLVGDLHPHVLSLPFLATAAALAVALCLGGGYPRGLPAPRDGASHLPRGPHVLLLAAVCGAIVATNSWDAPAALLLVTAAAAAGAAADGRAVPRAAAVGTTVLAGAWLSATPHLLTAGSQVRGLLPNLFDPTPLTDLLRLVGVFVPGLLALALLAWRQGAPSRRAVGLATAAVLAAAAGVLLCGAAWASLSAAGTSWLAGLPAPGGDPLAAASGRWLRGGTSLLALAAGLGLLLAVLAARRGAGALQPGLRALVLLAAVGLLLLLVPEIVVVHDLFGTRMNTVFKLHYQAWLLLGVAASAATVLAWPRRGVLRALAAGSLAALALGALYAPQALAARWREAAPAPRGLDGLAALAASHPGELAAIRWLRARSRPGDVVAQAPGDSYRAEQSRLAAATGRPTLLGWRGHELQWRGERYAALASGREEALRQLYRPESVAALGAALARWRVTYLYLGPEERRVYGLSAEDEAVLAAGMDVVLDTGGVRLLRRRG